jgi:putative hydrolase of the HAD superfamily
MTHTLKAVFFDMGNTLSCQTPLREDMLAQFVTDLGHPRTPRSVLRALLAADTWWYLWSQEHPFGWNDQAKAQEMRQQYRRVFIEDLGIEYTDEAQAALSDLFAASIMRRHNAIYPDVLPTIEALKKRGLRLAIVSNWDSSLTSHCDDLGMTPLFDTIVGSFYVGFEKPDPRIFAVALERLQVTADEVMHVGDMYVSDVVGARRAGIVPILLDRHDLQADADCLRVHTLDEILPLLPHDEGKAG